MSTLYTILRDRLEHEQGSAMATLIALQYPQNGPQNAEDSIRLSGSLQPQKVYPTSPETSSEFVLGGKLLVLPQHVTHGSLGLPALDALVLPDAERAIWAGTAQTHTYTIAEPNRAPRSFTVFIEGFPPPPSLIIVGAGHIAIPLTTFAKTLNYHVTIIDARSAFATRERFPHADEIIVAWPDEVLAKMDLNPATAIAVLTHDPKFDEPSLKVILAQPVGYVGAIGSRKTSEERAERLLRDGLSQEQLQRIHGPIGLKIGATSPEEIALAIMAEIVAARNSK